MKAYLANGLFSLQEQVFNDVLAKELRSIFSDIELYVPQENMAINDKNAYADSMMISKGDDKYLYESDILIAVLDGNDLGVACEIGSFATLGDIYGDKPIFALYTDSRLQGTDNPKKILALQDDPTENQFSYLNLYVVGKIKNSGGGIYHTVTSLLEGIEVYMDKKRQLK